MLYFIILVQMYYLYMYQLGYIVSSRFKSKNNNAIYAKNFACIIKRVQYHRINESLIEYNVGVGLLIEAF